MTKNEQIERMAESICMEYADGICSANHFICDHNCEYKIIASQFYSKGYRKVERGEWEEINDGIAETVYRCTVCNEEFYFESGVTIYANFCPNCGADMRKEDEGK